MDDEGRNPLLAQSTANQKAERLLGCSLSGKALSLQGGLRTMRRGLGPVLAVVVLLAAFSASDALAQEKGDPKAGKAIYDTQCFLCHGTAGAGDGTLAQKLKDKPSNWTAGGGGLKGMDDQKIFDVIAKGGIAIGKSKAMPANPKLSEAEVWNLVAYVKRLMK